ncbi:adenylyl cyclase-associated protein [Anaeramoeba flamelloides]|uniref:Adenylyl cyclase-associated protein n=1 Tax=Anaeramoeba flamelloides TaxID=1746091 RepID=A0AAV7YJT9_9EUKA|nr:adenylyl cyclase-associated protein [Anaeramoeba flamelloides]
MEKIEQLINRLEIVTSRLEKHVETQKQTVEVHSITQRPIQKKHEIPKIKKPKVYQDNIEFQKFAKLFHKLVFKTMGIEGPVQRGVLILKETFLELSSLITRAKSRKRPTTIEQWEKFLELLHDNINIINKLAEEFWFREIGLPLKIIKLTINTTLWCQMESGVTEFIDESIKNIKIVLLEYKEKFELNEKEHTILANMLSDYLDQYFDLIKKYYSNGLIWDQEKN